MGRGVRATVGHVKGGKGRSGERVTLVHGDQVNTSSEVV